MGSGLVSLVFFTKCGSGLEMVMRTFGAFVFFRILTNRGLPLLLVSHGFFFSRDSDLSFFRKEVMWLWPS